MSVNLCARRNLKAASSFIVGLNAVILQLFDRWRKSRPLDFVANGTFGICDDDTVNDALRLDENAAALFSVDQPFIRKFTQRATHRNSAHVELLNEIVERRQLCVGRIDARRNALSQLNRDVAV